MTIPNEWQGHLRNDQFRELLLTFEPEGKRVVGQYLETGPISMYQNVGGLASPPRGTSV
jgi:hypothetical protein